MSKTIGILNGIQWLLREGRSDPTQLACSDRDLVSMLDLVKEQLGGALSGASAHA